jgi:hypothetical protein
MVMVALGLGFAGYIQATRANNTEDEESAAGSNAFAGRRAYLANHQSGHGGGTLFHWTDTATPKQNEPFIGQCFYTPDEPSAPLSAGAGHSHEGSNDLIPPHSGGRGLFASNSGGGSSDGFDGGFFRGGFSGGAASASRGHGDNGKPGSAHDGPPAGTPTNTNGSESAGPGSAEPESGDAPPSNQHEEQTPPGPGTGDPQDPSKTPEEEHTPTGPGPDHPDEGGPYPPYFEDPPKDVHPVPEPATIGLFALGGLAAAALRRRRRN